MALKHEIVKILERHGLIDKSAPPYLSFDAEAYPGQDRKSHPAKYAEMVKNYNSWAYAAARPIIKEIASLEWHLNRILKTDPVLAQQQLHKHPILNLLKKPNPFINGFEFFHFISQSLLFTGNAYIIIQNADRIGIPAYMYNAYPQYMWVVPDKKNFIKGYLFERNGEQAAFLHPQDDRSRSPGAYYCIHLKYPSLLSQYYGVGPVEAGAYAMDTNLYMAQYNTALFKNGAFPGMVVETDERINETLEEELKERWDSAYRGVTKAGKILMLSYGYKVKPISLTPQQLTLLELMNITKEQIFMMFGTPYSLAGERSGVGKAGGDWANYDFYKSVVNPDAIMMKDKLQNDLVDRWDSKSDLVLGYKDIIPKDLQLEHKRRRENVESGIMASNEARAELDLPPEDWGEEPLVNNQLVPVSEVIDNPNNPAKLAQEAAKLQQQSNKPKQNEPKNSGKGGKNGENKRPSNT